MKRLVAPVVSSLVAMGAALLLLSSGHTGASAPSVTPSVSHTIHARVALRCATPAPTTVAGYARLFSGLPVSEWGAADGSMSVPLSDGRSVWLYGDTLSAGRFVHSTAITQDRGCLHVSHQGAQLLPNDDAKHIYWVLGATARGNSLLVRARAITLVGTGPWDFRDGGHTRTALTTVNATGDVTFVRWLRDVRSQAPNPGPMIDCEAPAASTPHHVCYSRHTHPEAHLAGGRVLITTCQNWDDGVFHPFAAYRPIFSSRSA